MDLELTDEQTWLAESVDHLLATSSREETWPALIDFGALALASGSGGDGLGAVELVLVGRALGRSLATVPFIDTVAARYATRPLASPAHPAFAALHGGEDTVSLCLLEPGTGWELARCTTTATRRNGGASVIDGEKVAVHHAAAAGELLVLYNDADERRLALVGRDAVGVRITPTATIDDSLESATVALSGVEVPDARSSPADQGEAVLARLLAIGGVLAASEAVGAAGQLVELARDYAAERRQFGRAIGSFQAVRHLLADMYVKEASAWSTVLFAAAALEDGIEDAGRTASIAKAYASRATLDVAHGALQVFGGIAFTAEHSVHRFLRRILVRAGQFGDARHHERVIGRELAARREQLVA
jgi:alkylation response protein AidB-like acyl-CoA dehydrogenase